MTIYLTSGIILVSLWLAYSPLFNQFLKIANSQENIIADGGSFKFKATSSNQVTFESCSENKITVVSLFTENCAFCFQEMKVLTKMEQMLNDTSILFISVHALTPYDSVQIKKVTSFVPFPIYHDSGLLLSKSLKIHGVPHLIVLDKNHKIRYHKEGFSAMESDFLIQQLTDKITEIKMEYQ